MTTMPTADVNAKACADFGIAHELDVPLGPKTWYGIGGHADLLAHPASHEQLHALVKHCHDTHAPMRILGSGANLLVRDSGVRGIVITLDDEHWRSCEFDHDAAQVTCGAGLDLTRLVAQAAREGLDGLVHVAGIPASIGGAVRMNAGGRMGDIGQTVASVDLMAEDGESYRRDRDDLEFYYRRTNITAPLILGAIFQLDPADPKELSKRVKEVWFFKKNSQPMSEHTAGCVFKNPDPRKSPAANGKGAGQLIDEAGLKGYSVGQAIVSDLHANFVAAMPGASADDVLAVMDHAVDVVREQFDVTLERELVVWGDAPDS